MRRLRLIVGIVLALIGAVWTLQGAGLLEGSFMTSDQRWLWIGIACVAVGVILVRRNLRSRPEG